MNKLTHKFFGELDLEKGLDDGLGIDFGDGVIVLWEQDVEEINTTLWYSKGTEASESLLDIFSSFLKDFDKYKDIARKELIEYLKKDEEYMSFHIDELEMEFPTDVVEFAKAMKVTNIGLWIDGENLIILDYMIAPEDSDEILAVKFNEDLEIVAIDWES